MDKTQKQLDKDIVKLTGCLKSPIKKHKQKQPDTDNDFTAIRCQ
jgi:hypothetical protein